MRRAAEIRSVFRDYFVGQGHSALPSSSLVPSADPSMLFTTAGMVQFKGRLASDERSLDVPAVVTVQRCLRAGGKHNDLENVGHTARHLTFFEMLGNFSFGNAGGYFKREAIHYAWDFLTREIQLDPSRLVISVLDGDVETERLWALELGSSQQIVRMGLEDNFWAMGDAVGTPCGPCSEIYWRKDDGELLEIWNLVFVEDRVGGGKLRFPSIDTGMGLERLCSVLEGVGSNYEIAAFGPLTREISSRLNLSDSQTPACRVIADHSRAAVFLAADGVFPSNVGRGHVMRRLIRRAARFAYLNGSADPLMHRLVPQVFESVAHFYPELESEAPRIEAIIRAEEESFFNLLPTGCEYLERHLSQIPASGVLDGAVVFKLSDAYGFPMDLTAQICAERGVSVDFKGAHQALDRHREVSRAKEALSFASVATCGKFVGPDGKDIVNVECTVVASPDANGWMSVDPCPFYPEGGGQIGDVGVLETTPGHPIARVVDCQSNANLGVMIQIDDPNIAFPVGSTVFASVDLEKRHQCSAHHTATHLAHSALRTIVSPLVAQAGSKVTPSGFRFDFVDPSPDRISNEGLMDQLNAAVNQMIDQEIPISTVETSLEEAKTNLGAIGLFGEKYGERVRVVLCESLSAELCGGTHASNTADLRPFVALSIRSIGSGVRRLEAKVGAAARDHLQRLHEAEQLRRERKAKGQMPTVDSSGGALLQITWISITLASAAKPLSIHRASNSVDLNMVKKKAHEFRAQDPSRIHLVVGPTKVPREMVLAVASNGSSDAREILKQVLNVCESRGGGGGGNAEFASGIAKNCGTMTPTWEKLVYF